MTNRLRVLVTALAVSFAGVATTHAAPITLLQPLFVDSTTDAGITLSYAGSLSIMDTLSFVVSGEACLQSGSTYCTNAAGVVLVPGSLGVGGSSTNPANSTTYGSLLLTIGGQTKQIFLPTASDGAGSLSPPTTLTLTQTALSDLGFSFGTLSNPIIEFSVSDQSFLRYDNFSGFSVNQSNSQTVPEPATVSILIAGLLCLGLATRRVRSLAAELWSNDRALTQMDATGSRNSIENDVGGFVQTKGFRFRVGRM